MKIARTYLSIAMLGVIVAFVLYAALHTAPLPKIRLAINLWPTDDLFYLAREKGFYAQEGVEVELVEISALGDSRRAFEREQVNAFSGTIPDVLEAHVGGAKASKIVMAIDYSNGADKILALAPLAKMHDLKEKKIGIEQSSYGRMVLLHALNLHGMAVADVELVVLDQVYMKEALEKGEVDAVVTYTPYSIDILKHPGARMLYNSSETPGAIVDIVTVSPALLEQGEEAVRRLVRAWDRALAYLHAYPDEALPIMAAREGITLEEMKEASAGIHMMPVSEQSEYLASGAMARAIDAAVPMLLSPREQEQVLPSADYIHLIRP